MRTKSALFLIAIALHSGVAWSAICGDAYFNNDVTWWHNSPLYYSVAGAPASTCGNLWAWRNGVGFNLEAGGWICTDGSGNATKGPWHHSNQADDETAQVYIDWGSCTSPVRTHIWDVGPPTATITSSCPSSAFSGTASDEAWGAGFNSDWAVCEAQFYNWSTHRWWNPATGSYNSTSQIFVACACNGMPSGNITWSCSSIPGSHVPGQSYGWYIQVWDGGQWGYDDCAF